MSEQVYLKKEDLDGKSYDVVQSLLEGETVKFGDEIQSKLTDDLTDEQAIEVLEEFEKNVVQELEEYDKYLDEVEYELPEFCEFEDTKFTRQQVAKMIVKYLNKNEVEWKFALGMYQMINLWQDRNLKSIKYKPYDSTLRMLGQVKYKGYEAWKEILIVNEFAAQCREKYAIDTAWLYFLTNKHNMILDMMSKYNHPSQEVPEVE